MTGPRSTGVNKPLVNQIKQVLIDDTVELDKVHVDKPRAGSLGGSQTANTLETLMNLATERINSALSETSKAMVSFVDGLDDAVRAVEDADEQARTDAHNLMTAGVDLISQPFFDNLVKDARLNLPDINLPFLPDFGALEEAATRAKFGQDDKAEG
ncbi:hypothetical protein J2S40_003713 [Nocardioides luteus]|uniref:Uncharacterized protein n=1 Tax=Nocardioides luteus TaxID=1844 RepID=A0ABQ5SY29_9ACTN|nr:hypothetical protein [Nocardioides luteus]MDR7312655.1 hypothetical protein [Nocardioides luteus]GGR46630.1 hypothetical protein GCM10010197_10400 [Nocardioides luteus]GLJ68904.1 hypothetical protein GCM10017579_29400 [Nocardioides luteus]